MATPEAPEGSPLGQYAFALKRHDKSVPAEPNTDVEDRLYLKLKHHFEQNKRLPDGEVNLLKSMFQSGWYAKVLTRPSVKIVYRGMSGDVLWVQKTFPHINWQNELERAIKTYEAFGASNEAFVLTNTEGTSWSVDADVAYGFAKPIDTSHFSVTCWAHVADNPLLLDAASDRKGLSLIKGLADMDEKEVISLQETMKCFKLEWSVGDPQEALNDLELYR